MSSIQEEITAALALNAYENDQDIIYVYESDEYCEDDNDEQNSNINVEVRRNDNEDSEENIPNQNDLPIKRVGKNFFFNYFLYK